MKKYRKHRENEGKSQITSLGDRFERISRRSCSTTPSTDCPSTLAEYFATQTGFAWSSRRTADCSIPLMLTVTELSSVCLPWAKSTVVTRSIIHEGSIFFLLAQPSRTMPKSIDLSIGRMLQRQPIDRQVNTPGDLQPARVDTFKDPSIVGVVLQFYFSK